MNDDKFHVLKYLDHIFDFDYQQKQNYINTILIFLKISIKLFNVYIFFREATIHAWYDHTIRYVINQNKKLTMQYKLLTFIFKNWLPLND